ncbi:MAG: tRNA (adenosine(37)-N6)-dimethylallyltransferase MiaA [Bacilli bacterium]|nr:tRNA (adenosine(37)-N6)-dimethylallyltransferase MiaA [Bacilli bacterium]
MINKVIAITGPTGIGKTELSLKIVGKYGGEIINADASQIRKKLNIGTAKLDLRNTTVPHHLIDFLEIEDSFSIYDYQKKARSLIDDLQERNILPFLIGGSGLYINAVLCDYDLTASSRNDSFGEKYKEYTNEQLHSLLQEVDSISAHKIPQNNRRRILRALEIALNGEKRVSENLFDHYAYNNLVICLETDRSILYKRINERVDKMFDDGWITECEELKKQGIDLRAIKEIGYKDIDDYLCNDKTLLEVKDMIKQKTRNYAKRQITWFRNKMKCVFVYMDYNDISTTINRVEEIIDKYLNE